MDNYKSDLHIMIWLNDDVFLGPIAGLEKRIETRVLNSREFEGRRLCDYKMEIVNDNKYETIFHVKLSRKKT